jgi:hypothetical protein
MTDHETALLTTYWTEDLESDWEIDRGVICWRCISDWDG